MSASAARSRALLAVAALLLAGAVSAQPAQLLTPVPASPGIEAAATAPGRGVAVKLEAG